MFGFIDLLNGNAYRPDPRNVFTSLARRMPGKSGIGAVFTKSEIFIIQLRFDDKGIATFSGEPTVVPRHERKQFEEATRRFEGNIALVVIDEPGVAHHFEQQVGGVSFSEDWHDVDSIVRNHSEEILSGPSSPTDSYRAVRNMDFTSALVFDSRQSAVKDAVDWVEKAGFQVTVVTSPIMVMFEAAVRSSIPASCDLLIVSKNCIMLVPVRDREWELDYHRYIESPFDYGRCKEILQQLQLERSIVSVEDLVVVAGSGIDSSLLGTIREDFAYKVDLLFNEGLPEIRCLVEADKEQGPADIRLDLPESNDHLNPKWMPVAIGSVALTVVLFFASILILGLNFWAGRSLGEANRELVELSEGIKTSIEKKELQQTAIKESHRLMEWSRGQFSSQALFLELAQETIDDVRMNSFYLESPDEGEVLIRIHLTGEQGDLDDQLLIYNGVFQRFGWQEIESASPTTETGLQFNGRYKVEEEA